MQNKFVPFMIFFSVEEVLTVLFVGEILTVVIVSFEDSSSLINPFFTLEMSLGSGSKRNLQ